MWIAYDFFGLFFEFLVIVRYARHIDGLRGVIGHGLTMVGSGICRCCAVLSWRSCGLKVLHSRQKGEGLLYDNLRRDRRTIIFSKQADSGTWTIKRRQLQTNRVRSLAIETLTCWENGIMFAPRRKKSCVLNLCRRSGL